MPKKKFIEKKNSVTFHLVHRSQQDPLTADETAPQRVLVPVPSKSSDGKKQIEEQQKFGIFFDDDYNYLQHLRDASKTMEWVQADTPDKPEKVTKSKLNLPSSVFASTVEEDVGLLNKAAPQSGLRLDLDPDVVAAMDDDFDFEDPDNELEDNFIELANEECSNEDDEDMNSNFSSEEQDEVGSLDGHQFTFKDEETKSRFTDYSMSSSVIRRNEQLTLLDKRFEKMYEGYDDTEIGGLEFDEVEGHIDVNSEALVQYAKEFNAQQAEKLDEDKTLKEKILELSRNTKEIFVPVEVKTKPKWDCESILSTYSNKYNHPKIIPVPIKINPLTGLPKNAPNSNRLTAKALSHLNDGYESKGPKSIGGQSMISQLSVLSIRNKNETPEEKKERKKLLKEYRKERRIEKKANREAFKEESKRQVQININNKNNVQGNRIL